MFAECSKLLYIPEISNWFITPSKELRNEFYYNYKISKDKKLFLLFKFHLELSDIFTKESIL